MTELFGRTVAISDDELMERVEVITEAFEKGLVEIRVHPNDYHEMKELCARDYPKCNVVMNSDVPLGFMYLFIIDEENE